MLWFLSLAMISAVTAPLLHGKKVENSAIECKLADTHFFAPIASA
jgi:hypothetical protein